MILPCASATRTSVEDLLLFSEDWGKVGFEPSELIRLLQGYSLRITVAIPGLPEEARPLRLVRLPPGTFLLGSPEREQGRSSNEGPVQGVIIDHEVWITETEVTQAQWRAVMGGMPSGFPEEGPGIGDNYPMFLVSWMDIVGRSAGGPSGFLDRLQIRGIGTFRLPTEQEWEYACRAGTETRFYFGDFLECDSDCSDCPGNPMEPNLSDYMVYCRMELGWEAVGQKLPNPFGLFDMHGNVFEWVQDTYHPSYEGAPTDGSAWEDPGSEIRVIRGGDWLSDAAGCRSAVRVPLSQDVRDSNVGFRLVRVR